MDNSVIQVGMVTVLLRDIIVGGIVLVAAGSVFTETEDDPQTYSNVEGE